MTKWRDLGQILVENMLLCILMFVTLKPVVLTVIKVLLYSTLETAVAQWLRCCATKREVAGSIPAGVIGIFH